MKSVFAILFGFHAVQELRRYLSGQATGGLWVLLAGGAMSLLTLVFGIRSFWRARKLRP